MNMIVHIKVLTIKIYSTCSVGTLRGSCATATSPPGHVQVLVHGPRRPQNQHLHDIERRRHKTFVSTSTYIHLPPVVFDEST